MQIRDIMTRDVQLVSPRDNLAKAATMMRDLDVGALPVSDDDRLVGMVTDRDITVRAVADNAKPEECLVSEVMSPAIKYVYDDQDTQEVARNMGDLQVRRLPVVSRDKRLVGIVSLADLALGTESEPYAKDALSGISQPARGE
jgi:CBS domain-containing protein